VQVIFQIRKCKQM